MGDSRQQIFLRLKAPCVHLSSVALKYRTKQVPAKDVLRALEDVYAVLLQLGTSNQLDSKLAEYAFFPIAQQVFNEAQTLSPRCLEVACDCVTILVTAGYRQSLSPELGKQLLILMTMLSGVGPNSRDRVPTDELKVAAFRCIKAIVETLASSGKDMTVFDDQSTKNVIDQLFYLLLDSVVEATSENVQLSASEAIRALVAAISNRVFLASLLPRTISSLTKALRESTKARRTQQVLKTNLDVVYLLLEKTFADRIALSQQDSADAETLDKSWLKASASQVRSALVHISKLRSHPKLSVRVQLQELCLLVIEQCAETLSESVPVMLETLVALAAQPDGATALEACRHLVLAYSPISEMLRDSLVTWSQSIPRILQGHDDRPKDALTQKLSVVLELLSGIEDGSRLVSDSLIPMLISGMASSGAGSNRIAIEPDYGAVVGLNPRLMIQGRISTAFNDFPLKQDSTNGNALRVLDVVAAIRKTNALLPAARNVVDSVNEAERQVRIMGIWLALHLLEPFSDSYGPDIDDFLQVDDDLTSHDNRKQILADLHASTMGSLLSSNDWGSRNTEDGWQLQSLAIRAAVMYAETFPGDSYRPELMETLYPVLSCLGSAHVQLRDCAIVALNRLAKTCQYSSAAELLIDNADYLVNSIAWNLNIYDLSPEAPQILAMVVHMCGTRLVPYLDDLIQSIFAALHTYHGYAQWVELLFQALRAIVDVSIKQPELVMGQDKITPSHHKTAQAVSGTKHILSDLRARKLRKLDFKRDANEAPTKAPQRPWTAQLDGPTFKDEIPEDGVGNGEESDDRLKPLKKDDEEEKKPSKPHSLLLQIATATASHLTSPSPKVRQLLLEVLGDVAPLLSKDENTFLPLINTIWPSVMPRLLSAQGSETIGEGEVAYNVCAAADTTAMLCKCAGDFMSTRVESIFEPLCVIFNAVAKEVGDKSLMESDQTKTDRNAKSTKSQLISIADLQIVETDKRSNSDDSALLKPLSQVVRTSKAQILEALLNLLATILTCTRVSIDNGDKIMDMLLPYMMGSEAIQQTLTGYNADAVWWYQVRHSKHERNAFIAQPLPVLRPQLEKLDFRLSTMVW